MKNLTPRLPLASLFVLALASTAVAAPDARLRAAAEQAQPALIETLHEMVSIESGSADLDGLKRMADLTEARLKALGAKTERRKVTTGPGADMVIATFEGTGTRKLMLIGHMDTVYPQGILASQPWRVDGAKIFGPGIADDKGGLAVVLHSLKILGEAGWKDYARLTVVFNPDEEIGSPGSGETIAQIADQHDIVLSCEPTASSPPAPHDSLLLGAAGTATAVLEVKGRAAHAGAAPDLGRNALIELSHQMLQTRDVAKSIPGTQLNWTRAEALGVSNQIPAAAKATADVRLMARDGADKLETALREKVASSKLVPDTETTLTLQVGRPPFLAGEAGRALGERAQAIYAEIDRPLDLTPMTGGATDAAFAGRSGKAAVLESFGLAGFGYHARDEFIDTATIVPRLYLMTRMLVELGKGR